MLSRVFGPEVLQVHTHSKCGARIFSGLIFGFLPTTPSFSSPGGSQLRKESHRGSDIRGDTSADFRNNFSGFINCWWKAFNAQRPAVLPVLRFCGCETGWIGMPPRLRDQGISIPVKDSLIAGSAQEHHLAGVTRNLRSFQMCGVAVLNPFPAEFHSASITSGQG